MLRTVRLSTGGILFLASVLVYSANLREISSQDTFPARLLPVAVIRDHSLALDTFFREYPAGSPLPYWVQHARGHYLSTYPVLPGLLAVPVYLVPLLLFGGDSWALINALAKMSATVMAALSVVLVYGAARQLGPASSALAVTLIYAFATSNWSVSSQGLWAHGPAQLGMAAAVYCALRGEARRRLLGAVGLAAGLMVTSRPTTGFVAAALIGYVLHRDRASGLIAGLAFLVVTLPVLGYNVWAFGTLEGGYAKLNASHGALVGIEGLWSTPLGEGVLGLLVSPSRGLLVYSPVLVLAFAGFVPAVSDHRRHFFHCLAAAFVASLLMLAKYTVWWGGHSFGPRYLSDLLPILVLFLVPLWAPWVTRSALLKAAAALLFAVSVGVQIIGAFYYPSPRGVDWNTSPQDVDLAHERLWDWRDTQLLRLLRNGPRPPGFASLD